MTSFTAASASDVSTPSSAAASRTPAGAPSRTALWTGRVLSGIATLFLLVDAGFKFVMTPEAVASTEQLGWPTDVIAGLGAVELAMLALYLVPRTAVLGAVLWTGYLGGAIATHLRVGNPWPTHTLFPIYVAALLWGGLWLRDRRVRALLAARERAAHQG